MQGHNTFLSFKISITHSETSPADKIKESLLKIATTIATSLKTGWSIDADYYDNNGNPKFKSHAGYSTIILNHVSGSVIRISQDNSNHVALAYVPSLSPINLAKEAAFSVNIPTNNLLPILSSNITDFFVVVDTSGDGIAFYYKNANHDICFTILGNYISLFCYPQNIKSVLNGLCLIAMSSNDNLQIQYFDDSWKSGTLNKGKLNASASVSGMAILTPMLFLDNHDQPYGYIASKCISCINTSVSITEGTIIDKGNFIYKYMEVWPCAFGWSPDNAAEDNPFYSD